MKQFTVLLLIIFLISCYNADSEFTFDGYLDKTTAPSISTPSDNGTEINIFPTISWDKVNYATDYKIWIDDNSDFSSPIVNGTNIQGTSYTFSTTALNPTTYYVKLQALNSESSTDESTIYSFVVSGDDNKPQSLSATSITDTTVRVNWTAPIDTTNLDGYNIYLSTTTPVDWIAGNKYNDVSSPFTGTQLDLTNPAERDYALTYTTTYHFFVVAVYSGSEASVKSDEYTFTYTAP